jgi:hypothetical protein
MSGDVCGGSAAVEVSDNALEVDALADRGVGL